MNTQNSSDFSLVNLDIASAPGFDSLLRCYSLLGDEFSSATFAYDSGFATFALRGSNAWVKSSCHAGGGSRWACEMDAHAVAMLISARVFSFSKPSDGYLICRSVSGDEFKVQARLVEPVTNKGRHVATWKYGASLMSRIGHAASVVGVAGWVILNITPNIVVVTTRSKTMGNSVCMFGDPPDRISRSGAWQVDVAPISLLTEFDLLPTGEVTASELGDGILLGNQVFSVWVKARRVEDTKLQRENPPCKSGFIRARHFKAFLSAASTPKDRLVQMSIGDNGKLFVETVSGPDMAMDLSDVYSGEPLSSGKFSSQAMLHALNSLASDKVEIGVCEHGIAVQSKGGWAVVEER